MLDQHENHWHGLKHFLHLRSKPSELTIALKVRSTIYDSHFCTEDWHVQIAPILKNCVTIKLLANRWWFVKNEFVNSNGQVRHRGLWWPVFYDRDNDLNARINIHWVHLIISNLRGPKGSKCFPDSSTKRSYFTSECGSIRRRHMASNGPNQICSASWNRGPKAYPRDHMMS